MSANSTVRVVFLGDAASAVRSVSTLEGRMGSLGGTAARAGKIMAGAIGISLAGSLIKATSLAIGFDREMRNVNSIAHLNERQFQALSKQVLALGKVSGQAPKVLASGLYDIVSSGFKAADALKILHASAIAATAGQTDVATASKGVTAVLNAYGLGADKARNVSSLLFKEVQLGVNTFGDLASQLGDTAPIAAALKIPFSDVAAGLALITLHGTPVTEASTQMARVMTDLLKPSKALSAELHNLGYENGQAAIQAHGFVPLIEQLSKAAGGPDGAAVKTAAWFQNIRSLRGMLNLTGPNLAKFNSFARQMAKSMRDGGDDVKAFNEQSKSISVRWDKATASLAAGAITLGTQLFPALIMGIGYLSDFAGWLSKLAGEHSIKAKIEFVGSSAEEYAQHVKSLVSQALFDGNKGADNPSTQRLQQPGMPTDLKFQRGFVAKAQEEILKLGGWDAIGLKIGSAIGHGLQIGRDDLGRLSSSLVSWADGPGGHQAGVVGAVIAANMVSTLLDPSFWIHHWQLALGIALAAMPAGKLAKIGELFAEGAFKLFGTSVGRVVIAGLGRLPGIVGESAPRFATAIGSMVEKAGIAGTGKFVEWAANAITKILSAFGALGGLLKALLYTGIVGAVAGLGGALFTAGVNLGESLASGVLKGIEGLPGKILSAVTPGGSGTKYLPGSNNGTQSPRTNPKTTTVHPKAAGDVINKPMLAVIGEDAPRFAEWVIPENPKYRTRALGLLGQASAALGVPGFAAGGGPGKGHHYTGHQLRKPKALSIKSVTGAAATAIAQLTAAQQRVADLGRTYDQDAREQGTVDLPPLTVDVPDDPTDPNGSSHSVLNPPGIAARVAQLQSLVGEKGNIMAALETERQRIADAITKVQAAIDALLDAIKKLNDKAKAEGVEARREHAAANTSSASVNKKGGLQDQVAAERNMKKPNKARIAKLEAAIKQAGRDHDAHEQSAKQHETYQGRYQQQAQTDAGKVSDLRGTLSGLLGNQHDLPFDVRDQQIDVDDLNQQIRQAQATSVSPFSPDTSSTGATSPSGGSSTLTDALAQDMAARLATYMAAVGLQGRQLGVLGGMPSFERGAIHIPHDMVAMLHSGEEVLTRDRAANGLQSQQGAAGPIIVHVYGAAVTDHIEAYIEQNGQMIAANVTAIQGRSADILRRSNRTA